jgi:hypothetical protein
MPSRHYQPVVGPLSKLSMTTVKLHEKELEDRRIASGGQEILTGRIKARPRQLSGCLKS